MNITNIEFLWSNSLISLTSWDLCFTLWEVTLDCLLLRWLLLDFYIKIIKFLIIILLWIIPIISSVTTLPTIHIASWTSLIAKSLRLRSTMTTPKMRSWRLSWMIASSSSSLWSLLSRALSKTWFRGFKLWWIELTCKTITLMSIMLSMIASSWITRWSSSPLHWVFAL